MSVDFSQGPSLDTVILVPALFATATGAITKSHGATLSGFLLLVLFHTMNSLNDECLFPQRPILSNDPPLPPFGGVSSTFVRFIRNPTNPSGGIRCCSNPTSLIAICLLEIFAIGTLRYGATFFGCLVASRIEFKLVSQALEKFSGASDCLLKFLSTLLAPGILVSCLRSYHGATFPFQSLSSPRLAVWVCGCLFQLIVPSARVCAAVFEKQDESNTANETLDSTCVVPVSSGTGKAPTRSASIPSIPRLIAAEITTLIAGVAIFVAMSQSFASDSTR